MRNDQFTKNTSPLILRKRESGLCRPPKGLVFCDLLRAEACLLSGDLQTIVPMEQVSVLGILRQ